MRRSLARHPEFWTILGAVASRNATRVVFGSNWGRLSPKDYTDAYEARLPAGWSN